MLTIHEKLEKERKKPEVATLTVLGSAWWSSARVELSPVLNSPYPICYYTLSSNKSSDLFNNFQIVRNLLNQHVCA